MKTEPPEELRRIYAQIADPECWGIPRGDILEYHRQGGRYRQSFRKDFGLTATMWTDAVQNCLIHFERAAGISFDKAVQNFMNKGRPIPAVEWRKIASGKSPVLESIITTAQEVLDPLEMYAVLATNLYTWSSRKSIDQVAADLDMLPSTFVKQIYQPAKSKLKETLNQVEERLGDHPFLRERKPMDSRLHDVDFSIDFDKLDTTDPNTLSLYFLSSTLFDADHHYLFCSNFLYDTQFPRNRVKIANLFQTSVDGVTKRIFATRELMFEVIRYEPRGVDYFHHRCFGDDFKGTHRDYIDADDVALEGNPAKIIFDICITQGSPHEAMPYVLMMLNKAEEKMSFRQIQELTDMKPETAMSNLVYMRAKIRQALDDMGLSEYLEHPIMRQRIYTDKDDMRATWYLKNHDPLERSELTGHDRFVINAASSIFNAKQYAIFLMSQYEQPGPGCAEIAERLQISDKTVYSSISKGIPLLMKALCFEDPKRYQESSFACEHMSRKQIMRIPVIEPELPAPEPARH